MLMQSLAKMTLTDVDVRVWVFFDNHDGLSQVYNKAIDNIGDSDFLVFAHDDLWLNDAFFFDKVINSKFDVIGNVGGLQYSVPGDWNTRPFIWSEACRGKASGFVLHKHPTVPGIFLPSTFGLSPLPCVWLDGQCLILNRKAVKRGLRFDEDFAFDFYDGSLCIRARNLGLEVGTAPILATHLSCGQGMMAHKERYLESQRKFLKKYL